MLSDFFCSKRRERISPQIDLFDFFISNRVAPYRLEPLFDTKFKCPLLSVRDFGSSQSVIIWFWYLEYIFIFRDIVRVRVINTSFIRRRKIRIREQLQQKNHRKERTKKEEEKKKHRINRKQKRKYPKDRLIVEKQTIDAC